MAFVPVFGWPDENGLIPGVVPDDPAGDHRDRTVGAAFRVALEGLVTRNRSKFSPTARNQKRSNACVPASGGYAFQYLEHLRRATSPQRSILFGWWEARLEEDRGQNVGCQLRDFWDRVRKVGLPSEPAWPFEKRPNDYLYRLELRPPPEAYEEAERWQDLAHYRIPDGDVEGIAAALDRGLLVHTSRPVHQSFYEGTGSSGVVPAPDGQYVSLHAETIFDVDQVNGVPHFVVCGTYGEGFGRGGWYYLPVATFGPVTRDTWVLTDAELPA